MHIKLAITTHQSIRVVRLVSGDSDLVSARTERSLRPTLAITISRKSFRFFLRGILGLRGGALVFCHFLSVHKSGGWAEYRLTLRFRAGGQPVGDKH